MKPKTTLLATSPTFEGIGAMISKYFFGCRKELRPDGDSWRLLREGVPMSDFRVVLVKGRYRFERIN